MTFLLGLAVIVFGIATVLLPWISRLAIKRLETEVEYLRKKVHQLELGQTAKGEISPSVSPAPTAAPVFQSTPEMMAEIPPARAIPAVASVPSDMTFIDEADDMDVPDIQFPGDVAPASKKPAFNFEQQFGARLPVWVGGISLALAGFYMVKYSIENNLVSPEVRVLFAIIMGLGFLGAGKWLFHRPGIANAARICQALTGAGITCLYGAFFAASSLYTLIPPAAGFIGMLGVTALAVIFSLSQGAAVAIFGLVGGFLTPILIGSKEPNTLLLFLYLSGLSLSLLYVARRQNWAWLALPVYCLSLLWALGWVVGAWRMDDAIWVSIYLLVLMFAAPFVFFKKDGEGATSPLPKYASVLGCFGSLLILSVITARAEFTSLHWSMFGLAGLGSMALAVFKPRLYHYAPAAAGAVTAFLLWTWQPSEIVEFMKIAGMFAVIYFAAGVSFVFRSPTPLWWSKLAILSLPILYILSYLKFGHDVRVAETLPHLWTWTAGIVAFVTVSLTASLQKKLSPDLVHKDKVVALSSLLSVTFLSWGLYLALDAQYLMLAYALQVAAVAWILQRYTYPFVSHALKVAAGLFVLSLLPYAEALGALILLRNYPHLTPDNFPVLPLLAASALLTGAGSLKLERYWKYALYGTSAVLGTAILFALTQFGLNHLMPEGYDRFLARVMTLDLVWAAALLSIWATTRFTKPGVQTLSMALIAYASSQTILVDLLMYFPKSSTPVGDVPLFNLLVLAYAVPALGFYVSARYLQLWEKVQFTKPASIAALAYGLLFVTLEVSHFYHAPQLGGSPRTLAEIYTYSVVWLISGIGLLVMGTLNRSRLLRVASLLVICGTVCKVFLYDASELDGILRVLSFLGLGLSLLGLSFFYTRFVFGRSDKS